LRLKGDFAPAHNNLGIAFWKQGRLDEAHQALTESLRHRPDFAEAHNNLSNVFRDQGLLDKALWHLDEGLRLKPDYVDARFNRSLIWLGQGDFHRGLPEYEFRWQRTEGVTKPPSGPPWDGAPLAGRTILLHAEQGLGDTLQFVRYAAPVKERGGKVILLCQKSLVPILKSAAGIDQLVAQGDLLPPFDVQAALMSLPRILGTTLETVPAAVPYLKARPELVEKWRGEIRKVSGFKVGIAWQGSPRYRADWQRSIPLARFEPLARVPGVTLISLQKGPGQEQLSGIGFPVWDLAERLDTSETGPFLDTAAVMQALDLLITSDSAIVHLAGALAVPIWVALPYMPDWRWLLEREDSPWYPTTRLFRKRVRGDWEEVFSRMAEQLRATATHSIGAFSKTN
jgi:hypothetical protein